ncbi:MAG TPA: ABC transporter substrate-binding protein [Burkholderiales bacterium]|jgi:branched-chain amino acid transport system substrate-binding protein|nr:ABC transporter substrate-binding protein [Burkholderiales bacterium]
MKRLSIASFAWLCALCALPALGADPYKIDVITSLTGGASFLGKGEQQALQLLAKSVNKSGGINGQPVEFTFYDDQSSPQVAVQLGSQLKAKNPAVILGPSIVAMCNATGPLMKDGPVMYCLSPGIHPPKGSFVFTSSTSTYDLAKALMRHFRMKGWKNIAIMTSSDASGQDAERGLNEAAGMPENKDIKIVARAHFNITDVSVAAQIENVKAANPQAFIAWSTGAPIATIFKGIVQAGLDVPTATTDGNMTYAQMKNYADFLPKQLYIASASWAGYGYEKLDPRLEKEIKAFYDEYAAIGQKPDLPASIGWNTGLIVIDALKKLGPKATATQLRDYLVNLKGVPSVDGLLDFPASPQRGLGLHDVVVTRWEPAKNTWVAVSKPGGEPLQ